MIESISDNFPFKSNYIVIFDSKMHYIDEGEGDPFLFLHGAPVSSYQWRNIIPYVTPIGRAIAPDLIGMGKSDKPDIKYRFHDHYKFLEAFINSMNLTNITLVVLDWGSGLGFHYASKYKEKIKSIVFWESMVKPFDSKMPFSLKFSFAFGRNRFINWIFLGVLNQFVKSGLQQLVLRKLTKEEKKNYQEPFKIRKSRRVLRQWPLEVPIKGKPADTHEIINQYSEWLKKTDIPKLMIHAQPGVLGYEEVLRWCENNLSNLTSIDIGPGKHLLQEDNPHMIGSEIVKWYKQHFKVGSTSEEM
jgi:haloalkane dehalogenase